MLNINAFFGQLAGKYIAHYNELAARIPEVDPTSLNSQPLGGTTDPLSPDSPQATDSYTNPTIDDGALIGSKQTEPPDTLELSDPSQTDPENGETTLGSPDNQLTTYDRTLSQLKYKLDMSFDASVFERTVHQISYSATTGGSSFNETLEQLTTATMGLNIDFRASGLNLTQTRVTAGPNSATEYQRQDTGHQLKNLLNQGLRGARALPASSRGVHSMALTKFAFRYKTDASFSFSHLARFNQQVTTVGEVQPESLEKYASQAGDLAEVGSNELLGAYFDSVDSYLGESEKTLLQNVEAFFNLAAAELGLSDESISLAKEQLTDSIESFFDRVEVSLSELKVQFIQSPDSGATTDVNQIETPTVTPLINDLGAFIPETAPPTEPISDPSLELMDAMLDALEEIEDQPTLADYLAEEEVSRLKEDPRELSRESLSSYA